MTRNEIELEDIIERIASVDEQSEEYSDGDEIEDKLLEIYSSKDPQAEIEYILNNNPSWPLYYHLSPQRAAVVSWINFDKGANVLEVGAGCGAVTEQLLKKGLNVEALELSERRATINAVRNKSYAENFKVIIGNLEQLINTKKRYDYIVCVGVLEYAGTFISGDKPYDKFLRLMRSLLKDDGGLVLAIENKLGLKYWAGAREDHTGGFFDSLNNYPGSKKVRTFGRAELELMLNRSKFKEINFYYPHPDYKHPRIIYSDDYMPGIDNISFPAGGLPTQVMGQHRLNLFSEFTAMKNIANNELFPYFANSFIAITGMKNNPIFASEQLSRKAKYTTSTTISNERTVTKKAQSSESVEHVSVVIKNYQTLSTLFKDSKILNIAKSSLNKEGEIVTEFCDGVNFENKLLELTLAGDDDALYKQFKLYEDIINEAASKHPIGLKDSSLTSCYAEGPARVNSELIDMVPDNLILNSDTLTFIDYEWSLESNSSIPASFLLNRAVIHVFSKQSDLLLMHSERLNLLSATPNLHIPKVVCENFSISIESIGLALKCEQKFQEHAGGANNTVESKLYTEFIETEPPSALLTSLLNFESRATILSGLLKEKEAELFEVKNSRTFKIAQKVANLKNHLLLR